jgi:hypothetical protein
MANSIDLSIDLSARFLKVACPVKMAGNSRQLKDVAAEIEVSKGAQVGRAVKASKALYADEYLTRVKKARNAIAAQHLKLTSVWNDSSWRLLPTGGWFDYANQMNPLIAEFDAAADELASRFDQAIQEAEYRLGDLYDRADYPETESEFRAMFRAEVAQEPLPQIADASRVSLPVAELDKMRQGMERAYQSNINRVKGEVYERLHDATSALAASLRKWEEGGQKSVKATLLDTIQNACGYAEQFNIDGDSRITALLADARACCTHDMETIRENPAIRAQVIDAATGAAAKAESRRKAIANLSGYML